MQIDPSSNNLVRFQMQNMNGGIPVGVITLNDPERMNAMTEEMARDFRDVVEGVKEEGPRAIIVTGEGEKFSAGDDMGAICCRQHEDVESRYERVLAFYRSFLDILDLDIPIIAAINGAAIGAGLCFACACDRRIAADSDEPTLGFSFAELGLEPGMGGTIFPQRVVGGMIANSMLRFPHYTSPRMALSVSMVDDVVPPEQLMDRAFDIATDITRSPQLACDIVSERVPRDERIAGLQREAQLQLQPFAMTKTAP